jgi:hypothetical protein
MIFEDVKNPAVEIGRGGGYCAILESDSKWVQVFDDDNSIKMSMSYQEWQEFMTPIYKEIT